MYDKKMKQQLLELIFLIALIAMLPLYNEYRDRKFEQDERKKTMDSNANSLENILGWKLQEYTKNEKMIAIADTDEKMRAYKSLDEILNVAKKLENEDVEAYFETWTMEGIPKKYYPIIEDEENEGYKFWVLIKGNYKDGFTAEVNYAKNDPFKKRR